MLVSQVRSYVGVPWRHQGRSMHGVDCIGLVGLTYKGVGVDWEEFLGFRDQRDYSRGPQQDLLRTISRLCEPIESVIDGCLVVMKFPQERYPRHVGLYAYGNLIHADARKGEVVEHGYRGLWKRCQHSLWKIPGVVYVADSRDPE